MKKVALVTGSRRGIGLATAHALSGAGYKVLLSDLIETEKFSGELTKFCSAGYDFEYYKCDISNEHDRRSVFEHATQRFGRLDVLVNNAGVAPRERMDILCTTEQSVREVLNINLFGTFFMCQHGANCMIAMQASGLKDYFPRIINISSISAYTSSINRGEYCISKAGVSMVTALFADKLAEYGIPVFEIRPGIIQTDMTAAVMDKYEELIREGLTPLKRIGKPEDVANCIMAAVSGNLDFATGQVLNADGGFHIRRL